ncbi:LysM peptidoglycan-binding domain-containing protein [Nocardioides sp. TF02-7]|uniref:LysM peptidoglycan-binding domain-containing protein n=1 Tax=Nocardioides sp. TF02-7 TaxID=2917724 RepID=UPI001F05FA02|nr:LysM peptidoglycan-binding domain-containing protein [Nocardioides sp. TF02-7]UMG93578.1 LysM peptidoglycan-binding domain-containing protein [Nocardioides sp. TF02-7]
MSTTTLAPRTAVRTARAAARPSTRRPSAGVRLTRRGRVVVFALGVLVAFALGVWFASGSVASQEAGESKAELVTVAPGDTLWAIASDVAADTGEGDVGDVVERIQEMNSLDSGMVYAGQELRVPTE